MSLGKPDMIVLHLKKKKNSLCEKEVCTSASVIIKITGNHRLLDLFRENEVKKTLSLFYLNSI